MWSRGRKGTKSRIRTSRSQPEGIGLLLNRKRIEETGQEPALNRSGSCVRKEGTWVYRWEYSYF